MNKSDELIEKFNKLNKEKEKLEEEIKVTLKEIKVAKHNESVKQEEEKCNKLKEAIHKVWDMYWKNEDNTEAERRLNEYKYSYQLENWLKKDIINGLKISKLEDLDKLKKIVNDCGAKINFDECVETVKIKLDFAEALRNVKYGHELSAKVDWGFSSDELLNLMKLHKQNKFRKKIENLLTDCNFHTASGLLKEKKYKEFEDFVKKDN